MRINVNVYFLFLIFWLKYLNTLHMAEYRLVELTVFDFYFS